DVTTSPTDMTAGRVLKVGDFGVGQPIVIPEGADLNDYTTPGEYVKRVSAYASPELNFPLEDGAGALKVMKASGGGIVQEYTIFGINRRKYLRGMEGGQWSSWVEFYTTNNISKLISDGNLYHTGNISKLISDGNLYHTGNI